MNSFEKIPNAIRASLLAVSLGLVAAPAVAQETYREIGNEPASEKAASNNDKQNVEAGKEPTHTQRISFSDKTKPGTLNINLQTSHIKVVGHDSDEILVASDLDSVDANQVDEEGFRRLDHEVAVSLSEKDNVATVRVAGSNQWATFGEEFLIKVPRNTNIVLRTDLSDYIEVNELTGDIEITAKNGNVSLSGVGGAVVVGTMSGDINVKMARAPEKALALTTMSGDVALAVPSKTTANLRMRTMNGTIRTNFSADVLKTTTASQSSSSKQTKESATNGRSVSVTVSKDDAKKDPKSEPAIIVNSDSATNNTSYSDVVDAIVETRTAQAIAMTQEGIAAAQRGMVLAAQSIDGIGGLTDAEKELIKRGIEKGVDSVGRSMSAFSVPAIGGGKLISGELNGGGVNIKINTMNGDITLKDQK